MTNLKSPTYSYEVTVPIVVTVDIQYDEEWNSEEVHVAAVEISTDWGGFFSEAEEARGCWNATEKQWDDDDEAFMAARRAVLDRMTEGLR